MSEEEMRLWLLLWGLQIAVGIAVAVVTRQAAGGSGSGERFLRRLILVLGLLPLGGYALVVQLPLAALLLLIRRGKSAQARRARGRLLAGGELGGAPLLPPSGDRRPLPLDGFRADDANPFA